jgi:hypothetical protein
MNRIPPELCKIASNIHLNELLQHLKCLDIWVIYICGGERDREKMCRTSIKGNECACMKRNIQNSTEKNQFSSHMSALLLHCEQAGMHKYKVAVISREETGRVLRIN